MVATTLKRRGHIVSKTSKSKKYILEGFIWNLRGPVDQKSKALVLAATGWWAISRNNTV
jgi:hypothetical protein